MTDATRDLLFPPDVKPSNAHRHQAIAYNAYERNKPLRYEAQHEAGRMNGRDIPDPGFILFDLFWRCRVNYNRNERPIFLEMNARNLLYRREMTMYDETPNTGLIAALLAAQEVWAGLWRSEALIREAMDLARDARAEGFGFLEGVAFASELVMARKRHLTPALIKADMAMKDARQALVKHATARAKHWEVPYGISPNVGARWRIEGDLLAVVAQPGNHIPAYATRRVPYRPYRSSREHVALAAERAAEILPIIGTTGIDADRLLREGDHILNQPFLYADNSRTERDVKRAIANRVFRAARFAEVDMGEHMIMEAIQYVLDHSPRNTIAAD